MPLPSCLHSLGRVIVGFSLRLEGFKMTSELRLSSSPSQPRNAVRSLWLDGAENRPVHEPLQGAVTADVCIVGGGFTGLWTALMLKADDPSLDVALIEGDICGGGASGRNGGFVMSWWSKFSTLKKLCGTEEAIRLARASADGITEIGRFCEEFDIDADYHQDGWLWAATSSIQVGDWETTVEAAEACGETPFKRLSNEEVGRRAHSPVHIAGVFEPACATVDPGRLVTGMTRVAVEHGVRIFEHSAVTRIVTGGRPVVHTDSGTLQADRIVLAINAWSAALPEFKRALVIVASDVIATAPIPDRLTAIGWDDGVAVSDSRRLVNYYRRTDNGRIVFGKGGGTLGFNGQVNGAFHRESPRRADVEAHFHRSYPMFWDVPAVRSWSGPIDYSISGMPSFVRMGDQPNIIAAAGFSGNGVGPSYIAGRILASMALDKDDEWAHTGLAAHPKGALPPEPARYLGGLVVRAAIARKENIEDANRVPGRLTKLIAGLDPTSFVDRGAAGVIQPTSTATTSTLNAGAAPNLATLLRGREQHDDVSSPS